MPARPLRLRLLITLYRAFLDMPILDEIPWDEGDFSRLVLDDPSIGQKLFEEGVPRPEICYNLPTWDLRPWASDASHRILEPEVLSSVEVGNFGPQKLICSKKTRDFSMRAGMLHSRSMLVPKSQRVLCTVAQI